MITFVQYTIRNTFGQFRAYIVDPEVQEIVEGMTGQKSLTRQVAQGLHRLGINLEYRGDVDYADDPIYPHGNHRPENRDPEVEESIAAG